MRSKFSAVAALVLVAAITMGNDGCEGVDRKQARETERQVEEAHSRVGMPGLTDFTERELAKRILEMRDKRLMTYTYVIDMSGGLHFLCQSMGYGLPYSVQFVNPERYHANGATLPQAEPNGLFMPESSNATWITCLDEAGQELAPIYAEPEILVSPFPLKNVQNNYQ